MSFLCRIRRTKRVSIRFLKLRNSSELLICVPCVWTLAKRTGQPKWWHVCDASGILEKKTETAEQNYEWGGG